MAKIVSDTIGIALFAVRGKGTKTHGTAFAVRLFPKCTAKGARLIFTR
jgi:hypothetical protein